MVNVSGISSRYIKKKTLGHIATRRISLVYKNNFDAGAYGEKGTIRDADHIQHIFPSFDMVA